MGRGRMTAMRERLKAEAKKTTPRPPKYSDLNTQEEIEQLEIRLKSNRRDLEILFKGDNKAVESKIKYMEDTIERLKQQLEGGKK